LDFFYFLQKKEADVRMLHIGLDYFSKEQFVFAWLRLVSE